jgi:hypothetical protein
MQGPQPEDGCFSPQGIGLRGHRNIGRTASVHL